VIVIKLGRVVGSKSSAFTVGATLRFAEDVLAWADTCRIFKGALGHGYAVELCRMEVFDKIEVLTTLEVTRGYNEVDVSPFAKTLASNRIEFPRDDAKNHYSIPTSVTCRSTAGID
jgi:hypothetical protein